MLYEMVCGRPSFVGDGSVAIIGQHLNTPPVAPTWHRPDCPVGLETLEILRLLEKDASKRPASAAEVRAGLESIARSGSPASEQPNLESPHVHDPLYRGDPSSAGNRNCGNCMMPSTPRSQATAL